MDPADSGKLYSFLVSPDGDEFYFFKHTGPGDEDYRIFRARRATNGWTAPEEVDLGASPSDLYPALSPDGERLVFSSYRAAPGDTSKYKNAHLWMARRKDGGWDTPAFISTSRLGWYHSGLHADSAGNLTLRLTSPDWNATENVELPWLDSAFASGFRPVPDSATDYWRAHLGDSVYVWGSVAGPDGWALVQISKVEKKGRRGPAVYYTSQRSEEGWGPLKQAGGGLGVGSPNFVWFSRDQCTVYYTRNYSGFIRVPFAAVTK
jgi:hypothetical protein